MAGGDLEFKSKKILEAGESIFEHIGELIFEDIGELIFEHIG